MLDSDAPLSDLIPLVKRWLEEGYKETKAAATKSEFYTWTEHYDNWICIVRPLIRLLSDSDKYDSMIFFRFVEIQKNPDVALHLRALRRISLSHQGTTIRSGIDDASILPRRGTCECRHGLHT